MSKVSIIVPTIRPGNIKRLLSTITSNAGIQQSNYEVIVMEDTNRIGAPKMVKNLVAMAKHDLVMFLGDDTMPQKNFLKNAIKTMKKFPKMDGMVGLMDPNRKYGEAPTHWMASKQLLPALGGEFFHTGYIHQYCDNELAARALKLGKLIMSEDSIIVHTHPGFSDKSKTFDENIKNCSDKDYKRVYSDKASEHDEKLFHKRMEQFGILKSTGERVTPGDMRHDILTLQEHMARYNFALGFCVNGTVLDAACGAGYGTHMLNEAAISATGWDISPEAINFAKSKYNGTFEIKDLSKKLPDKHFDTIVSFETIEHMKDPNNFLKWVVGHCDSFIFSIPLDNPSKYHLQVYSFDKIEKLFHKYWKEVQWSTQSWINIYPGVHPNSTFVIGICHKKDTKKNLTK